VNTYTVPGVNVPIDYGVQAYIDLPGAKAFFARFGVAVETAAQPPFVNKYIDFTTGKPVSGYPPSDQNAVNVALGTYAQIAAKYNAYIFPGYYALPLPLPEDLVMPFGQFVQKYNIQAALSIIWSFAVGSLTSTGISYPDPGALC